MDGSSIQKYVGSKQIGFDLMEHNTRVTPQVNLLNLVPECLYNVTIKH